jgi:hypothetical protein
MSGMKAWKNPNASAVMIICFLSIFEKHIPFVIDTAHASIDSPIDVSNNVIAPIIFSIVIIKLRPMHVKTAMHESRQLRQARSEDHYVDLPHNRANYSLTKYVRIIACLIFLCQELL